MAIKLKSVTNYTIDGVIHTDLNKTLRNVHHYKINYTYSILTSKLSHTKTQKEKTIIKRQQ